MDVKKDFFVVFACCFHQRKVQCWKPLRSCSLLISLHIWCWCCAKGGPIHKPTDCKKKEKICQKPSCWLPRCLWGLLHVDPNVWKVFLPCCSDHKHLLGPRCCFPSSSSSSSLSLPGVQGGAGHTQPVDTPSASGFPELCYHRSPSLLSW